MKQTQNFSLDPFSASGHLGSPLFSMKGLHAGPRLVVTGSEDLARQLAERFWDLPSLGRMRGSLVVRANTQDPVFDRPDFTMNVGGTDTIDAYYDVLGRMADLGMISGRGVPVRRVA